MTESKDTKTQMRAVAARLFAERGYYGVSLANIAAELGLTKQALIHHFATKDRLYAEVLTGVSNRISQLSDATGATPEAQLESFFDGFCAYAISHPTDTRLLLRELLDNKHSTGQQGADWYLEPFLRGLIRRLQATSRWRDAPDPQALAICYQLLGALSYFVASQAALKQIIGAAHYSELQDIFPGEFRRTLRALL